MHDDLVLHATPRWVDAFPWLRGTDADAAWERPADAAACPDLDERIATIAHLAIETQASHTLHEVFPLLAPGLLLKDLPLTPRLHNVLRRHQLHTGADLESITVGDLLSSMQVGPWTVDSIFRTLAEVSISPPLPESPAPEPEQEADLTPSEALARSVASLEPRMRAILLRRLLAPVPATLADLGEEFGVTRERVRQLEKKTLDVLGEPLGLTRPTVTVIFDAYRDRGVDAAAVLGVEPPARPTTAPAPPPQRSQRPLYRRF